MEKQNNQSAAPAAGTGASRVHSQSEPEHRKPSFKSNVIMTIKVFAVGGLILMLLWFLDKGKS